MTVKELQKSGYVQVDDHPTAKDFLVNHGGLEICEPFINDKVTPNLLLIMGVELTRAYDRAVCAGTLPYPPLIFAVAEHPLVVGRVVIFVKRDEKIVTDAFETAEYYDCNESEELNHTSPEEAIEAYLDKYREPGSDYLALIQKHSPVVVIALNSMPIEDDWITHQAKSLLEMAEEEFMEEFGDPNGDHDVDLDKVRGLTIMVEALKQFYSRAKPWTCVEVGKREYSADQVESLMRRERPEWFEKEPS